MANVLNFLSSLDTSLKTTAADAMSAAAALKDEAAAAPPAPSAVIAQIEMLIERIEKLEIDMAWLDYKLRHRRRRSSWTGRILKRLFN